MGLKKYADKIDDYFKRLNEGKVEKIQASHVTKVIDKLRTKRQQLEDEIEATVKESKKARLERKMLIADEHIKRAEMLLAQIGAPAQTEAKAPAD